MVFVTMFFTLRSHETKRSTKIASIIAAALVVGQITLGAFVIVEKLHAVPCNYAPGNGINFICYDTYCILGCKRYS